MSGNTAPLIRTPRFRLDFRRLLPILAVVVAVSLIYGVFMLLRPDPPIAAPIRKQLTSALLLPAAETVMIDADSIKYDSGLKVLSFDAPIDGIRLSVSEQPTPENFTDIPQVYDKVVEQMRVYKKFETAIGIVYLTKPESRKGSQTAVMNTKGTLLFANPDKDLSDDQWRRFFNSFDVVR
jgi:hypothetical protein